MEKIGAERFFDVVGKPEAEPVDIECHHRVDVLDRQHGMSDAERAGAETRDRAPRTEWRVVDLGAVECLEPVAAGIAKRDQAGDAPCVRQRPWLGRDGDPGRFQPACELIEAGGVGDFPAEEARAFAHRTVDDDALLAVVHPERQQRIAALDGLQADQGGPELSPVLQRIRSEARVTQTQHCCHPVPPADFFRALLPPPPLASNATRILAVSNPKSWAPGLSKGSYWRLVPPLTSLPADGD